MEDCRYAIDRDVVSSYYYNQVFKTYLPNDILKRKYLESRLVGQDHQKGSEKRKSHP